MGVLEHTQRIELIGDCEMSAGVVEERGVTPRHIHIGRRVDGSGDGEGHERCLRDAVGGERTLCAKDPFERHRDREV